MKSKRVGCNALGGWGSKKKPFTAETQRTQSRQDEVSLSSLRPRRLCGSIGIAMSPVADLLLVAIFGSEKCALGFCEVESVMKMIFHSVRQSVRISRRTCATLSNTPLLFFHMENRFGSRQPANTRSAQSNLSPMITVLQGRSCTRNLARKNKCAKTREEVGSRFASRLLNCVFSTS